MDLPQKKIMLPSPRILFFGLSLVSLVVGACGAVAHYRKSGWGDLAHPIGWLLSMFFLLLSVSPPPRQLVDRFRSSINPRTAFFAFWTLFFVATHLWHFRTAPWNGNGLFDESGWDLHFLKSYVMGRPFQAAWFHLSIARETLFHYCIWPFLWLFGFNVLSYEAALLFIWCATFLFTLLLVDLFFRSNIVTSVTALAFNFLPFAFIYTFVGYRYPLATALSVASLYFLHRGFRGPSRFFLCLGGITAGLCLASSISGKQYLVVLFLFALFYAGLHWRSLRQRNIGAAILLITYGCVAAAIPILCFIVFNREDYTRYEANFIHTFLQAVRGHPAIYDLAGYVAQLKNCFFGVGRYRFLLPDVLPIPVPYYFFLLPGLAVAVWKKRYEVALLAVLPVAGAFIAYCYENRLLLAIPFWMILMAFAFDWLLKWRLKPVFRIALLATSAILILAGLVPSLRFLSRTAQNPLSIRYFMQSELAASRFLRRIVAGAPPRNPPRLEHNEFNRIRNLPEASFETLVCQDDAYSSLHLFLQDYDDKKIMSFCDDLPFNIMDERAIWTANRKAIANQVPNGKDLKLIWEKHSKTARIIKMFERFRDLGTEETISYVFEGKERQFHVLNVRSPDIVHLKERVQALPDSLP